MKDMIGKRFGRLTVIEFAGMNYRRSATWRCLCDCGNEKTVDGNCLRMGWTRSCGCLNDEMRHVKKPKTHGMTNTRIHRIWKAMKARCHNKNDKLYGGRGIAVCSDWNNFEPFYKWAIENGYADNLSIDRIDPNGNYCPENCRWADASTQAKNKRLTCVATINGETRPLKEWASITGIRYDTLWKRMKKGVMGTDLIK
jgi:hypothetical protein